MRYLTVRHVTTYRYSEPVRFGEHRMMFRLRARVTICGSSAPCSISVPSRRGSAGLHDVFDNSVAIGDLRRNGDRAGFDSTIVLEHTGTALPNYALSDGRIVSLPVFRTMNVLTSSAV